MHNFRKKDCPILGIILTLWRTHHIVLICLILLQIHESMSPRAAVGKSWIRHRRRAKQLGQRCWGVWDLIFLGSLGLGEGCGATQPPRLRHDLPGPWTGFPWVGGEGWGGSEVGRASSIKLLQIIFYDCIGIKIITFDPNCSLSSLWCWKKFEHFCEPLKVLQASGTLSTMPNGWIRPDSPKIGGRIQWYRAPECIIRPTLVLPMEKSGPAWGAGV